MFSLASPTRAAERGRWAHRRKGKSASGSRVRGASRLWRCGRESIRLHHAVFLGFGCGSWCVGLFRPAGVPSGRGASRPAPVAPLGFARGSGWAARFLWSGWGCKVSSLPEAQPGAQGDAGLCFGRFSPSSARPRPLARALGVRGFAFYSHIRLGDRS